MRATIPTVLAATAAGLLLANQANRRRHPVTAFSYDAEDMMERAMPAAGVLVGLGALAAGGVFLARYLKQSPGSSESSNVEESIELEVPVRVAYNQWTQFEQFPQFMSTVEEVKQISDTHLRWRANVGGKTKEWESEITEQVPDKRIAWRSTQGPRNSGVVTFHKIGENRTRVMLQMDYRPESMDERVADAVGAVKLTTKGNLQRFKDLVEKRGTETGGWRGVVPQH